MLVDEANSSAHHEASYDIPAAGSVGDVQAYWTEGVHDNSEYNTEYEDVGGDGEADQGAGSEMGIDEELAQLA